MSHVNATVQRIGEVTRANAHNAENSAAAGRNLKTQSATLQELLDELHAAGERSAAASSPDADEKMDPANESAVTEAQADSPHAFTATAAPAHRNGRSRETLSV